MLTALLADPKAVPAPARLRVVKFLNRFAASLCTALLAFNAAYPQAISSAGLPAWAVIPVGILWFMLIEYVTKQRSEQNSQ